MQVKLHTLLEKPENDKLLFVDDVNCLAIKANAS